MTPWQCGPVETHVMAQDQGYRGHTFHKMQAHLRSFKLDAWRRRRVQSKWGKTKGPLGILRIQSSDARMKTSTEVRKTVPWVHQGRQTPNRTDVSASVCPVTQRGGSLFQESIPIQRPSRLPLSSARHCRGEIPKPSSRSSSGWKLVNSFTKTLLNNLVQTSVTFSVCWLTWTAIF